MVPSSTRCRASARVSRRTGRWMRRSMRKLCSSFHQTKLAARLAASAASNRSRSAGSAICWRAALDAGRRVPTAHGPAGGGEVVQVALGQQLADGGQRGGRPLRPRRAVDGAGLVGALPPDGQELLELGPPGGAVRRGGERGAHRVRVLGGELRAQAQLVGPRGERHQPLVGLQVGRLLPGQPAGDLRAVQPELHRQPVQAKVVGGQQVHDLEVDGPAAAVEDVGVLQRSPQLVRGPARRGPGRRSGRSRRPARSPGPASTRRSRPADCCSSGPNRRALDSICHPDEIGI